MYWIRCSKYIYIYMVSLGKCSYLIDQLSIFPLMWLYNGCHFYWFHHPFSAIYSWFIGSLCKLELWCWRDKNVRGINYCKSFNLQLEDFHLSWRHAKTYGIDERYLHCFSSFLVNRQLFVIFKETFVHFKCWKILKLLKIWSFSLSWLCILMHLWSLRDIGQVICLGNSLFFISTWKEWFVVYVLIMHECLWVYNWCEMTV